jgi:hypothetical protein
MGALADPLIIDQGQPQFEAASSDTALTCWNLFASFRAPLTALSARLSDRPRLGIGRLRETLELGEDLEP